MSAIYLQGNKNSKYPTLDPTCKDPLLLWIFRCANFGYADASSLSCTAKNLIATFYRKHFPNGLHKMSEDDIKFCEVLLCESYSDDILIPIYLSMIAQEDKHPSFPHPSNWSSMSDLEKAHMLVKNYFLKLLALIDFSDFNLKSVTSLFSEIEEFLNRDVRLECNKIKPEQHLESVRKEIEMTRQKTDFHINALPNDYPNHKDHFKFLGLVTCKKEDTLKLRPKPLSEI